MSWYPSVEDIIDANITVLDISVNKHPHKLLVAPQAIQSVIDRDVSFYQPDWDQDC